MTRICLFITVVTLIIFAWAYYERKINNNKLWKIDITSIKTLFVFILLLIPYINFAIVCGFILAKASYLLWNLPDYFRHEK